MNLIDLLSAPVQEYWVMREFGYINLLSCVVKKNYSGWAKYLYCSLHGHTAAQQQDDSVLLACYSIVDKTNCCFVFFTTNRLFQHGNKIIKGR